MLRLTQRTPSRALAALARAGPGRATSEPQRPNVLFQGHANTILISSSQQTRIQTLPATGRGPGGPPGGPT